MSPGRKRHFDVMSGVLRRLLHAHRAPKDDQVRNAGPLPAGRTVKIPLDLFINLQHPLSFSGSFDFPATLWFEPDAAAIGSASLVGPAKCRG